MNESNLDKNKENYRSRPYDAYVGNSTFKNKGNNNNILNDLALKSNTISYQNNVNYNNEYNYYLNNNLVNDNYNKNNNFNDYNNELEVEILRYKYNLKSNQK